MFIYANQISEVLCFVQNCILQELLQIKSGTTQASGDLSLSNRGRLLNQVVFKL